MQLPESGPNFRAYSNLGVSLGRTYVHSAVRDIVIDAYAALAASRSDLTFKYGETGWKNGGRMRPHRTHRNGLSVDFMVPVRDRAKRSIPLPGSARNKYGYGVNFDDNGTFDDISIDFDAVAEHLYQLDTAAHAHGVALALVIFDRRYLPKLFATSRGEYLRSHLPFMKGTPWIRHDQHYHVDFAVPCSRRNV